MAATPSPSPETDDISIGSVLDGRYRIDAILGSGGMGRVYRGEHTGIGKRVAIKVLHADLSRNREAAQRFQREAIASGRLDHPNIVGVSDFGIVEQGPCYLVMEVLEGEPLGARLEREKRLPWQEAVAILRGVLAGLAHAHDRGVVHRDIKPDNVFLANKDGETIVKILDFGIAKLYAGSPDDPASTRAGLTVGTPAYLSPEQAVGGEIKPASDLYSATILLFEMITGRAPFEDKDPLAMLGAHVSRTPPTIAEIAPELGVPQSLETVIQKGLVKAQDERIGSATDYIGLLDSVASAFAPAAASEGLASIGYAHTHSALTPAPIATPPPGTIPSGPHTPSPFTLQPFPSPDAAPHGAAPTMALPTSVTLGNAPPLPTNWLKIGAVVLGAIIVLSILFAVSGSGKDPSPTPPAKVEEKKPKTAPNLEPKKSEPKKSEPKASSENVEKTVPKPEAKPELPPQVPSLMPPLPPDKDTQLKAALHDLQNGPQCVDRKTAIPKIVAIGDKSAIPALKKARYRGRGGLLGIGERNANACLRKDAEAAIKALGGTLK
ncbi:MAG: protein kinase domain-containing protein [Kofleriaceae bacterium]